MSEGSDDIDAPLTELIYEASTAPERWQDFVELLSSACGDAAVAIVLQHTDPGIPSRAFRHHLDRKLSGLLNTMMHRGLPWITPPSHERYKREFVRGSEFFPDEGLPASAIYREFMAPQGLAPEAPLAHTLSAFKVRPGSAVVVFRRLGQRALGSSEMALCNRLVPHLDRAFRVHTHAHGEKEQRRALAEVIDRLPMGVMLLDGQHRCISTNASADRILRMHDGVMLDRERPTVNDQRRNEELHRAIEEAVAGATRGGRAGQVIAAARPSGGTPISIMVTPLLAADEPGEAEAAVAVFIADPNAGAASQEVLRELYSLTPAESALVGLLVAGRSLDEIASMRGIQTSTARSYLKIVYRKTETHSQQDLVRLILSGVGPIGAAKRRRGAASS